MPRIFAYCRVSTSEQDTQNQKLEIESAGFSVRANRIIEEHISGSVAAKQRPGFVRLMDRLEQEDILVVTKLDRLGRNAIDVRETVEALSELGVKVHCLALGGADLTSTAGKMTMQVVSAVAEFEKDLLIERTQSGLERARAKGKQLGRPPSLTKEQKAEVKKRLTEGSSVSSLAREYQTSRQTIQRARDYSDRVTS
ncbi:recombinase family protein [Dongshaea marina]|uniref:recombinase family protein n=1 Tax=Dongshaea marina TaxID=2047966 RepID=UPI000D3E8F75|nr:recombinase family protein [Dongshaea marina]